MTIAFFVLVIEKVERNYHAYSPSFAGLSANGPSRESVERSMLEQMNSKVKVLNTRHAEGSHRLELSTQPIQEKIPCLAHNGSCKSPTSRDGFCAQHWRIGYGHEYGTGPSIYKTCQLCGTQDPEIVTRWDTPCEFKATHSDWPIVLQRKKQEASAARRIAKEEAKRQEKIAAMPVQCSAIRTQGPKGVQCLNKAQRDGLCTSHWKSKFGETEGE